MATNEVSLLDTALERVAKLDAITLSGVSPAVLERISTTDAMHLAVYAGSLDNISQWILADLLLWTEQRVERVTKGLPKHEFWAARNEAWEEMLKLVGKEYDYYAMMHMRNTARAWPYHMRRPSVSFEHHRLLNSRDDFEKMSWLDRVEDMNLSTRALRFHLSQTEDVELLPEEEGQPPTVGSTRTIAPAAMRRVSQSVVRIESDREVLVFSAAIEAGKPVLRIEAEPCPA